MEAGTIEIVSGSICLICNVGKSIFMGPLIVCAFCQKARLPYELQSELYQLTEQESSTAH